MNVSEARGVTADSREIAPGFIFVAIDGVKQDGHAFIAEAIAKGAAAVVSERPAPVDCPVEWVRVADARAELSRLASSFYKDPSRRVRVVGITGTNGKTTTSFLLEHLWNALGKKPGVLGTISYRFAGEEIPATETTPGPVKLQAMLARMRDAGVDCAAMEVSSHALDQKRADGVDFAAAVFTNLTQDHLDYHSSLDAYFAAKARLFEMLAPGRPAVINLDDARGKELAARTRGKVFTYSIGKPADFSAQSVAYQRSGGTRFDLVRNGKTIAVRSPLAGPYNVSNVLAALAAVDALEFDLERACAAVESFGGVPGRLEAVDCGQDFKVFIDFAHTPDGLENVLAALRRMGPKRLFAVFGCGGDRDRTKRPQMAAIAARFCDHVFLTSDNPRSEDPKSILEEVKKGFPSAFKDYSVIVDRPRAVRQALLSAREGDAVLLAGKGHERAQIVGSQRIPYHERTEAEKVLHGF